MSARKRAARREDARVCGHDPDSALYAALRALYRIGQRLRPCRCDACTPACYGCEDLVHEGEICERCGRVHQARRECDGSGVRPAKKARKCAGCIGNDPPRSPGSCLACDGSGKVAHGAG